MAKSVKERTREYRQRLREEGYKQYLIQLNSTAQEWLERIRDEQGLTVSDAVHSALHTWSRFEERENEWEKAKRDKEISDLQSRLDAANHQMGRMLGHADTSDKPIRPAAPKNRRARIPDYREAWDNLIDNHKEPAMVQAVGIVNMLNEIEKTPYHAPALQYITFWLNEIRHNTAKKLSQEARSSAPDTSNNNP